LFKIEVIKVRECPRGHHSRQAHEGNRAFLAEIMQIIDPVAHEPDRKAEQRGEGGPAEDAEKNGNREQKKGFHDDSKLSCDELVTVNDPEMIADGSQKNRNQEIHQDKHEAEADKFAQKKVGALDRL